MASIGAIFSSTYHTEQLSTWPKSPASHVVNRSQHSACQGEIEPFKDHLNTYGYLTNLINKPQQKHPRKLPAPIPAYIVSYCVQLLFDGEKRVLLLCAWKSAFPKSIYINSTYVVNVSCRYSTVQEAISCIGGWACSWFIV